MDDIWDEPAAVSTAASRNEPLFLPSGDEQPRERGKSAKTKPPAGKKNAHEDLDDLVEDLFDDVIDENDFIDVPDVEALVAKRARETKDASKGSKSTRDDDEKENDAKNASNKPDGDEEGASKPRRTIAKVDDERLLGERGFPALIKEAKTFKPRGKGHEAEDLDRLMEIYQFWSHGMFPKTQFRDTVDRVERVCRSRRMQVNMSMWRDDGKPREEEKIDPNMSDESDREGNRSQKGATSGKEHALVAEAPRVIQVDEDDWWEDMNEANAEVDVINAKTSAPLRKHVATNPMDDDDLEDWFNADSEVRAAPLQATGPEPPDQMDLDEPHKTLSNPRRFLSPPTADNWDEDLYG